jgi:hypothetical protein
LLYLIHRGLLMISNSMWFSVGSATLLLILFTLFISKIEKKEFQRLPFFGRFFVPKTA